MGGTEKSRQIQEPCIHYLQDRCRYGDRCRYSHQGFSTAYMVRHAESEFNKQVSDTPNFGYSHLPHLIHLKKNLIDCGLTEEGKVLCAKTCIPEGYLPKNREVDIVFVSPMNRALETADIMLNANKVKVRRVIVIPELSEVLSKICDFGGGLKDKREKYKYYDFS